ncbi:hypothetical protein GY45DRAFT_19136 [Cubamyces sp. BRFM 1775]|nr:hypothetical protein GY45DRAFT_19136 [Cubamyces sp. BRFM 1775]
MTLPGSNGMHAVEASSFPMRPNWFSIRPSFLCTSGAAGQVDDHTNLRTVSTPRHPIVDRRAGEAPPSSSLGFITTHAHINWTGRCCLQTEAGPCAAMAGRAADATRAAADAHAREADLPAHIGTGGAFQAVAMAGSNSHWAGIPASCNVLSTALRVNVVHDVGFDGGCKSAAWGRASGRGRVR